MLRDYQEEALKALASYWSKKSDPCILQLATGCHEAGAEILMADGSTKRADEVQVGDLLMGRTSPTKVIRLHKGRQKMFKVIPVKGKPFVVNAGHILHVLHYFKHNKDNATIWERKEIDISVSEYLKQTKTWKHCTKIIYSGYNYGNDPKIEVFEPYLIGVYLGDGVTFNKQERQPIITNVDAPVIEKCRASVERHGWEFKQLSDYRDWSIRSSGKFKRMMFSVGAMGEGKFNKIFPSVALSWSRESRLELLAGVLDSDGSLSRNGIDFIQKNEQIANGVVKLARSLGIMATIHKSYKRCQSFKEKRLYWRVHISGKGLDSVPMVKHKIHPNIQKKNQMLTGFSVEEYGEGNYYGWEVDANDHIYLDGELVLQHNSGKSHIIAEIVKRTGQSVLVLQPSKEILEQNYEKLLKVGVPEKDIQICSASAGSWNIGKITLATIGTIWKHSVYCQHFKIVIIDECDVVPVDRAESQYVAFLNLIPEARVVGLTATPWRNQTFIKKYEDPRVYCRPLTRIFCKGGKGSPRGQWFWTGGVIYKCDIASLQERNYLSPTVYHIAEADWSFVRDVAGRTDFDTEEMTRFMDIEANTSRFTQAISWCMANGLKTIVFSPNIDMNFRLANVIKALGGTVECMDSENDTKTSREGKMEAFRNGKFQFLVNVGMVGRGVDVPSVDAVVLCRPTKSLSLYMQYVGRCLRLDPNNPDKVAYVLDLSGNVDRFGKVEDVKLAKIKKFKYGHEYLTDAIVVKRGNKQRVWDQVS